MRNLVTSAGPPSPDPLKPSEALRILKNVGVLSHEAHVREERAGLRKGSRKVGKYIYI